VAPPQFLHLLVFVVGDVDLGDGVVVEFSLIGGSGFG
jgi:hypothetical protein